MSNVLAVAQKELKAFFSSPMGYVLVGMWVFLFGAFYVNILAYFMRMSLQMGQFGMSGPQSVNVNEMMIRPLMQNVTVLMLIVLPMITMRTYAEEKRSGTIELLLTSPLTDFQIILGKFFGALGLYAVMLAITFVHLALLYFFGTPEWKPIASGYLGLLLMGACFISVGLFISSLTKNQIVAGVATFSVFLLLWIIDWFATFASPGASRVLEYLSIVRHGEDFWKGVIDTTHVIYYLSFITFGLFLTAKSVDSERWRG
jgi:ABC-2 type transport system permease protein